MERLVIVAYRPFPGKEKELLKLMKTHVEILRKEGLASNRNSIIMQSKDNTIIEVFGWKSSEAIESAHTNLAVQKMWESYAKVCESIPISNVAEAGQLFSEFTPIN